MINRLKQYKPKPLNTILPNGAIIRFLPDDYKLFHEIVPQRLKQECEPIVSANENHSQPDVPQ